MLVCGLHTSIEAIDAGMSRVAGKNVWTLQMLSLLFTHYASCNRRLFARYLGVTLNALWQKAKAVGLAKVRVAPLGVIRHRMEK